MRSTKLAAVLAVATLTGLVPSSSHETTSRITHTLIGMETDSIARGGSSYEDGEKLALRDLEQGLKQYVVFGLLIDGRQIEKHLASYGLEAYFAGCVVSDWGDGYNDTVRRKLGIGERIQTLFALEPAVDL